VITAAQIQSTNFWLDHFSEVLTANPPLRLHVRAIDGGGNPEWHPEFAHWLTATSGRTEGSEARARLKRAMKRLHERSLREYEVLTRVLVRNEPMPEVTEWLNIRAIAGGHPDRYRNADTLVILYAAIDKIRDWY
jgi:hypothetical protein